MPTYRITRNRREFIFSTPTKRRSKYQPHTGAKESAKFIANLEPEEVPCEGCGVYGEPNYAGGKRYCGSQYCCP